MSLFRLTNILIFCLFTTNANANDFDIGLIFDEINKISKKNIELNLRGNFSSLEKSKYSVVKLLNGNSSGAGVLINYNEENFILTALHVVDKSDHSTVIFPFDTKCLEAKKKDKVCPITEIIKYNELSDLALLRMPISLKDDYSIKFNSLNSKDGTSIYTYGHPSGAEWAYDEGYISLRETKKIQTSSDGRLIEVESYRIRSVGMGFGSSGSPVFEKNTNTFIGLFYSESPEDSFFNAITSNEIDNFLKTDHSIKVPKLITQNHSQHKPIGVQSSAQNKIFSFDTNKNGRVDSIVIQNNATGLKTEKHDKNENDFYEMTVKEYLCHSENKKFRFAIVDQDENNKLDHFVDYALLDLNYDFIWDKVALTSFVPSCENI